MQIIKEVAAKHDLVTSTKKLFNEVNGSGKHNNWSIVTNDLVNLLAPDKISEASKDNDAFPIVMADIVAFVDEHSDLMRAVISLSGNFELERNFSIIR